MRFNGKFRDTVRANATLEKTKAHFADLETFGRAHPDNKSWEVVDGELHVVWNPLSQMGVTFHGEYTLRLELTSENVLEWRTTKTNNFWASGFSRFRRISDRVTEIEHGWDLEIEVEGPRLIGKLATPWVHFKFWSNSRNHLQALLASLERSA